MIFLNGDVVTVLKDTPVYGIGHWPDTTIRAGTRATVIRAEPGMDEYEIRAANATAVVHGQWLKFVHGQRSSPTGGAAGRAAET